MRYIMANELDQILNEIRDASDPNELVTLSSQLTAILSKNTARVFESIISAEQRFKSERLSKELHVVNAIKTVLMEHGKNMERNVRESIQILLNRNQDDIEIHQRLKEEFSRMLKEAGYDSIIDFFEV